MARSAFSRHSSSHVDSNSENCYSRSLRQTVFEVLQKDPSLKAKEICGQLGLSYGKCGPYVNNCKSFWKSNYRTERGSKCSIHAWRGWCYVPDGVDRTRALSVGWICSRARNRWLLWKDRLGRLQWFETGRVNLYVRKPANLGRAYQLVCNGFSFTGLITDVKVLEGVLAGVKFKGAHYVFETEHRLPRLVIDLFTRSNGVVIKVGDASHPSGIEVATCYPDWAERNERMFEEIKKLFRKDFHQKDRFKKPDYVT